MRRPYREVTGAERKEMREFYAVHRNYRYVALAFGRDVHTVRRHIGASSLAFSSVSSAVADERARQIVQISSAARHSDRDAAAKALGLKNAHSLSVMLCRARGRLAEAGA